MKLFIEHVVIKHEAELLAYATRLDKVMVIYKLIICNFFAAFRSNKGLQKFTNFESCFYLVGGRGRKKDVSNYDSWYALLHDFHNFLFM